MALLLPVLQKAKNSVRTIECASNLRQIGMWAMEYTTDWNGVPPTNGCRETDDELTMKAYYYWEISSSYWFKKCPYYKNPPSYPWRNLKNSIMLCPQAQYIMPENDKVSDARYELSTTYAISTAMGGGRAKPTLPADKVNMSILNATSFWFADAQASWWANGPGGMGQPGYYFETRYVNLGWAKPWMWYYPQKQGHGGTHCANLLFGDVHYELTPRK